MRRAAPTLLLVAVGLVAAIGGLLLARGLGAAAPSESATPGATLSVVASPSPLTSSSPSPVPSGMDLVGATLAPCEAGPTDDDRQACYAVALDDLVLPEADPRPIVQAIADIAWAAGGYLQGHCHGLMHTVAREYVAAHDVRLESLMDYLPSNNDPGCSAGFAHGVVAGLGPQLNLQRPGGAAATCDEAPTRYQRYSCVHGFGHAFMRLTDEDLEKALVLCTSLGDAVAPDCAQGAYHDYWFAVIGADDTKPPATLITDPRELCSTQPEPYVPACWYRAFVDTRPAGFVAGVEAFEALCADLAGVQRSSCITAVSVIGPPDPAEQLYGCEALDDAADAISCIHGTKVQNLLHEPPEALTDLIGRCAPFPGDIATACYTWLGKTLAVITDGAFEQTGCPTLPSPAAREACVAGARSMNEPLITFS